MKIKESEIKELIRSTIEEEVQGLKEAEKYRDFFMNSLRKAGDILDKDVSSPRDLTDEEKKVFFNFIDTKWDNESGDVEDVDLDLENMLGEAKIRERVRKEIKSFAS